MALGYRSLVPVANGQEHGPKPRPTNQHPKAKTTGVGPLPGSPPLPYSGFEKEAIGITLRLFGTVVEYFGADDTLIRMVEEII